MILFKKRKAKGLVNRLYIMGIAFFTVACSKNKQTVETAETVKADTVTQTYVELGFLGPVKQEKWADLVQAVKNNIAHSRREPGNLSFSLYLPENDTLQPIWFERFKTDEAHTFHMQQDYFKNAIMVIQQSLAGKALSIALKDLGEVPAMIPKSTTTKTTHSITLYDIKPSNRRQFITTMAGVAAKQRAVAGNVEYNLYQYKNEPDKFVLIEGWQNNPRNVQEPGAGYFAGKPIRYVVKDVSESL
jgi:quinol monooxygenase YgiN